MIRRSHHPGSTLGIVAPQKGDRNIVSDAGVAAVAANAALPRMSSPMQERTEFSPSSGWWNKNGFYRRSPPQPEHLIMW